MIFILYYLNFDFYEFIYIDETEKIFYKNAYNSGLKKSMHKNRELQ